MPHYMLSLAIAVVAAPALPAAVAQTAPAVANPASANCLRQGGTLQIEKDGRGGRFGVCRFDDNRQCEEWALLRGACPAGGIRVNGYVTPAARYCALRGGSYQVLSGSNTAAEQGSCGFGDGKACAARALFDGLCNPATAAGTAHARFHCEGGGAVDAVFSQGTPGSVSLVLPDGRALSLPQAPSASGARYADAGEVLVFWTKGEGAVIDEAGRPGYRGCVAVR